MFSIVLSMKVEYTEGSENYNVWHGKYDRERFSGRDREPADTKCDPELDTGYTLAPPME